MSTGKRIKRKSCLLILQFQQFKVLCWAAVRMLSLKNNILYFRIIVSDSQQSCVQNPTVNKKGLESASHTTEKL